jgi:hypothetical protein
MIWELRAQIDGFSSLVIVDDADIRAGMFAVNGSPKDWAHRPAVKFFVDPRRKKLKPRANVIHLKMGALVLDAKAKLALGSFLSKFGQLLELHREGDGEVLWLYNVTNVIPCLDEAKSERDETGMIMSEAFDESKVPKAASVFKDPKMGVIRIYVNDAGRAEIERLASDAGLTGVECGAPQRF